MKMYSLLFLIGLITVNVYADEFEMKHENGNTYLTGELVNDKKQGTWKYYFENGKVQAIEKYSNGRPVGIWKYYDAKGRLKKRINTIENPVGCSFGSDGSSYCGTGSMRTTPYGH